MKRHAAPIIAAVLLLLLPVLYVGSYFALVVPGGDMWNPDPVQRAQGIGTPTGSNYRLGGIRANQFFGPLEQIDRKVRPHAWEGYKFDDDFEPFSKSL
jgi:hypothetical protein